MQTGFVAGTLVHTRQGLRPIEQIEVGDYVLSKPESGEGEVAYKRVVRTVERDDCETWFVSWEDVSLREELAERRITPEQFLAAHGNSFVITTPNHPFWVVDCDEEQFKWLELPEHLAHLGEPWPKHEWVRADQLIDGMRLMLHDGRIIEVVTSAPTYRSGVQDRLWVDALGSGNRGLLVDLQSQGVTPSVHVMGNVILRDEYWKYVVENPDRSHVDDCPVGQARETWYRTKVYNIEVEGCHNYFIDTLGVWVHAAGCHEN